ncbi:MAG: fibrillarin-like rRNA/tRNA 2'-O-methyltransferase [Candidatus Aenigmatarchaeota archaeon]|nr:fibrillarin-like rRNA/tRNA 2'-O-methyltransferase [Candidatus Aenigmarchaeota archaeon]
MVKIEKTKFYGIFKVDGNLATVNLVPGEKVYGEELIKEKNVEYRYWDYWRSKPAAAIKNGLKILPLEKGMNILYLGIANGTTASHFSDIIGKEGLIYGVEISERPFRELLPLVEKRGNIVPILSNARKPEDYEDQILGKVDLVYEDVATEDQVEILIRNCEKFLKSEGFAIIAIKSQSIDVTRPPKEVYDECLQKLEKHFEILDKVKLDPYEKFHLFVVMKSKK